MGVNSEPEPGLESCIGLCSRERGRSQGKTACRSLIRPTRPPTMVMQMSRGYLRNSRPLIILKNTNSEKITATRSAGADRPRTSRSSSNLSQTESSPEPCHKTVIAEADGQREYFSANTRQIIALRPVPCDRSPIPVDPPRRAGR